MPFRGSLMEHWEHGAILKALKQVLKARKISYQNLAEMISVSEPTVKRIFSGGECSVSRLLDICESLKISFFELTQIANSQDFSAYHITAQQDQFFADNPQGYFLLR